MQQVTALKSKGCTREDIRRAAAWQDQQPSIGCGRKFLVTMNGQPFAGFDKHHEAVAALKMYAEQERPKQHGFKFELVAR